MKFKYLLAFIITLNFSSVCYSSHADDVSDLKKLFKVMATFGAFSTLLDVLEPMMEKDHDVLGVKFCAWGSVTAEICSAISAFGYAAYKGCKNKTFCKKPSWDCIKENKELIGCVALTGFAVWLDIWYNLIMREDDWKSSKDREYWLFVGASIANFAATHASIYNHYHVHRGRPAITPVLDGHSTAFISP